MLVESRYLNVEQLKKFLSLKKSRIYYLSHSRAIPCIRIGHTLLFDREEIHRWLEGKRVSQTD